MAETVKQEARPVRQERQRPRFSFVGNTPAPRESVSTEQGIRHSLVITMVVLGLIYLAFAAIGPSLLHSEFASSGTGRPPAEMAKPLLSVRTARLISLALSIVIGATSALLWWRGAAGHWGNWLGMGLGAICLIEALGYLLTGPFLLRVRHLTIAIVAMGCIFLALRPLVISLLLIVTIWFTVAWLCYPQQSWQRCIPAVLATSVISLVACRVRRGSAARIVQGNLVSQRLHEELSHRVHLGETASQISSQFLRAEGDELPKIIDEALGTIGRILEVDHVFLCRINADRLTVTTINEWSAPAAAGGKPAGEHNRIWFSEKTLAQHASLVADVQSLPAASRPGQALFKRLDVRAFASIPLATKQNHPWGYLAAAHFTEPIAWSADDVAFLRTVGENLLLTMERHQARAAARRSEARFRQLFDANVFPVFFASIYGSITDGNDAFLELAGYERPDLPLRWETVIPGRWRGRFEASITRLVTEGADHAKDLEIIGRGGEQIPVLFAAALLLGDRGEFIAIAIDLRDLRAAQQRIQELNAELHRLGRLEVMGEMAAGLAHEIHQPLAAIANYANGARRRLQRGRLPDESLVHLFNEIDDLCQQAGSVAGNIRNFVRGRGPLREPVAVNETIERSLEIAQFELCRCEVDVKTEFDEDLPPAMANSTELSQILLNLIINAAHAMENQQSPRVLTIVSQLTNPAQIAMRIRDTGPGIPEEFHSRLFDQFFTTKETGLGMGLPLSRSIAQSYGGSLELAETSPGGTLFLVLLPIAEEG